MSTGLVYDSPQIKKTLKDVRNDSTDTSWMILGYDDDEKSLKVVETGDGSEEDGWDEFKESLCDDCEIHYGLFRLTDKRGTSKFILVVFSGQSVEGRRRGYLIKHAHSVTRFVFPHHHIKLNATDEDALPDWDELLEKAMKASGVKFPVSFLGQLFQFISYLREK